MSLLSKIFQFFARVYRKGLCEIGIHKFAPYYKELFDDGRKCRRCGLKQIFNPRIRAWVAFDERLFPPWLRKKVRKAKVKIDDKKGV